jgi:hypothetical protein
MKKVISGYGLDTTTTVLAWLRSKTGPLIITHLYMIGEPDDPRAYRFTDWQAPLIYSLYGKFAPAVIERGSVKTQIGLDVTSLELTWHPDKVDYIANLSLAGPYQLASNGIFKDWPVRIWSCYMPTLGDANTYGCSELFGGRIGSTLCQRGAISFTVNSFLDVINQKIPSGVVTITNTMAPTLGAVHPVGFSTIPQFSIITGSTNTTLICACTTTPGHIFDDNALVNGFIMFNRTGSSTLGGQWSAIQSNKKVTILGTDYNQLQLFQRLPFAPTPGLDTLYISGAPPINILDGDYYGFPYVPQPETAA